MSVPFPKSKEFFASFPQAEYSDRIEAMIADLYRATLRPGDAAIDGGAHVGLHTLGMARCVAPGGLVLAVEALTRLATGPLPKAIKAAGLDDSVVIENVALGAKAGTVTFHDVVAAPGYSGLRARSDLPPAATGSVAEVTVEMVPLDTLAARHVSGGRPVRFVKLDLEGGEFDCLRGAGALLATHRPLVAFEHGQNKTAELYGYTREAFFDFFDSVGYRLETVLGEPMTRENWGTGYAVWCVIARPTA